MFVASRKLRIALGIAVLAWLAQPAPGHGGESVAPARTPAGESPNQQNAEPRYEFFTGLDLVGNDVSGYLGGSMAFGKSVRQGRGLWSPGWRARAVGALGSYDYLSEGRSYDGRNSFLAALLGYQFSRGKATYKLFAGIEAEDQDITPFDPGNAVQGNALGVRLAAESWFDLGPKLYASMDGAYGSAFGDYWSLARIGFRRTARISYGLEGGLQGNREYSAGRGGAFARLSLRPCDLTLATGLTGDYLESEGSAYLSLSAYRAF